MQFKNKPELAVAFLLALPFAGVFFAYLTALNGPFLFDDFPNLESLNITDWNSLVNFVIGNQSGPLGRPLSMITFVLNDIAWPSQPYRFKETNLLLHLCVGLLLFWFLYLLLESSFERKVGIWLALLTTSIWLSLPLHLSTTLYVIQRMTILSTLWCLAAGIAYIKFRHRLFEEVWTVKSVLLLLLVFVFIGFGVLSKENALVFGLAILALEAAILRYQLPVDKKNKVILTSILLILPLVLLGYHLFSFNSILHSYVAREFSIDQKLILIAPIYTSYLLQLLDLDRSVPTIFHDDFIASIYAQPAFIVTAWVGWIVLGAVLFYYRRKSNLLWFGFAWFVVLHLLEAGPVAIELYFEHRNYLPSIGVCLFLVCLAHKILDGRLKLVVAMGFALFLFNIQLLFLNAKTWADPLLMSYTWSIQHRDSLRSQLFYAQVLETIGLRNHSQLVFLDVAERFPENLGSNIDLLRIDCMEGHSIEESLKLLELKGATARYDTSVIYSLDSLIRAGAKSCLNNRENLHRFIDVLTQLQDDKYLTKRARDATKFHFDLAMIFAQFGDLNQAMEYLDDAYAYTPSVDVCLYKANWLLSAGLIEQAESELRLAHELNTQRAFYSPSRANEIDFHFDLAKQLRQKELE